MKRKLSRTDYVAWIMLMQLVPVTGIADDAKTASISWRHNLGVMPLPGKTLPAPEQVARAMASTAPASAEERSQPLAPSDEPARAGRFKFEELTLEELQSNKFIRNFDAAKMGNDPNSELILYGKVFKECWEGNMSIEVDTSPRQTGDKIGVMIKDPTGKGRECLERASKEKWSCGASQHPCSDISKLGGRINLNQIPLTREDGKVDLAIIHLDPNLNERDERQAQPFSRNLSYENAAVIQAKREETARTDRATRIERLQQSVANCRGTLDNIAIAKSANAALRSMGAPGDFAKVQAELEKAEKSLIARERKEQFNKLKKRADSFITVSASGKPPEDIDVLVADIKSFAIANNDDAKLQKACDNMIINVVKASISKGSRKVEDFDKADEIIADLMDPDGNLVAQKQSEMTIARAQLMCTASGIPPYSCQNAYQGAYDMAYQSYQNNCMSFSFAGFYGYSNSSMSSPGCYDAMTMMQTVGQIPYQMQMAQQQIMQMQQQAAAFSRPMMPTMPGQQIMPGQPMQPGVNNGMPMQSSPATMLNGQVLPQAAPLYMQSQQQMAPQASIMPSPQWNNFGQAGMNGQMGMNMNAGGRLF